MRAFQLFCLALATSAHGLEQPEPLAANIAWVSQGEYCEPETVLPMPDNTLLISNVCGFGEPNNGFLSLLKADGTVINWRIVDALDSPLGMALFESRLYVVDNNRVKVFSWPDYQLIESIEMGTTVANDIAIGRDGTLFVTDSAKHSVVKRQTDGTLHSLNPEFRFENANGLQFFGSGLYVGGARLWRVDLQSDDIVTVGPDWLADIDGIEFETDGALQVTPVGGPLIRYWSEERIEIHAGDGISSANHGYLADQRLVLIPTGYDNTVIAIRIESETPND